MSDKTKQYTNGEVTIHWNPEACSHSAICVGGLPEVFNPKARPWVNIEAATTDKLIEQVKKCPSGALSFSMHNQTLDTDVSTTPNTSIEVVAGGPLLVHGSLEVKNCDGSIEVKSKRTAFCRCGVSSNKPYCDGSHRDTDFDS